MKNGSTHKITIEHLDGNVRQHHEFLNYTTQRGLMRVVNRLTDYYINQPDVRSVEIKQVGPEYSGF